MNLRASILVRKQFFFRDKGLGVKEFQRSEMETQSRMFKLTSEAVRSLSGGGAGDLQRVSHIQRGDLD